jgi:hypothetical protein
MIATSILPASTIMVLILVYVKMAIMAMELTVMTWMNARSLTNVTQMQPV